ncbi:MAG: riboflavin biosynthesis protein RibF [Dysgonamonadaceae bacterium]|jgi:riboflavin kinase/FMN adenylyltransferase|nr:riboflavin biosynthesis protein RibF [Dysgonamonadaceae bacterium]
MEIVHINDSYRSFYETASTIGFFDGVHRGHRYLIEQLKAKAQQVNLPSSVVTFSSHPRKVIQSEYSIKLLNSFDEKMHLLASTGIDYCYVIDFTPSFSEITAENFMKEILNRQLKIKFLLIGYNHRFGKSSNQGFEDYREFGKKNDITVEKACEFSDKVSSTAIRRSLLEGNVKKAAEMLSYSYTLEGNVAHGNRLGHTIGFPTANLELIEKDKLVPAEGVYAGRVVIDREIYYGMIYIGRRPTVSSCGEERIEAHLFDFDANIYGKKIQVEFFDFVRQDISFSNIKDLQNQLKNDETQIRSFFHS